MNRTVTQFTAPDGTTIRLVYDEEADMLDIFFGENRKATGVELTGHILLRIDQATGQAVSLTILDFSLLTELTEYGPRSYPLLGLDDLPDDFREQVVRILKLPPVNQFLRLSHFQASHTDPIPTAFVEPHPLPVPA